MSEPSDDLALAEGQPTMTKILILLATMRDGQKTISRAVDDARAVTAEQHRQVMTRMDTFVPRAEIEAESKRVHDRIDGLKIELMDADKRLGERVDRVDGKLWKGLAWLAGVFGTAIAGGLTIHFRG